MIFLSGCMQAFHNTSIPNDIQSDSRGLFSNSNSPDKLEVSVATPKESKQSLSKTEQKLIETDSLNSKNLNLSETETEESYSQAAAVDQLNSEEDKCKILPKETLPSSHVQPIFDEALDLCQVSQDFWQKGELENAIEALDQAYSLILKVEIDDNPKFIQQQEDLRFMISKRILEIYASRNTVVNGNHKEIPIEINKHIQFEIDLLTTGIEKKFFVESFKRSGKYREAIVETLKEAGLPVELSWLPLIESGFKVNALSKARALGLWQFIPSTGYKFGLKRNIYIDERLDPVKSTKAALAYMQELHQIFGDWTTVLAAYNCGEGKVLRIIRNQNVNYLDNFWDLYELLPRETARYVPRFLATLHIVNNPKKYGLDSIDIDSPLEYETVNISKQAHLRDIADNLQISQTILQELNPELRYKILPEDTTYPLKVPPAYSDTLLAKLDNIPVSSLPRQSFIYHRVRSGETVSSIATRYGTSIFSIARANNLNKNNYIVAGKKLKIPLKKLKSYRSNNIVQTIKEKKSKHIVRRGDSLWIIAKLYGTTTQKIQALNNLATTNLHIGQVLNLPILNDANSQGIEAKVYKVKSGDSPFKIANRHNMPLKRFLNINHLSHNSKIYPGQNVYIE